MVDADSRAAEGASRKAKREAKEKKRARQKLWEQQRQVKSEEIGTIVLQKLYRGHLGRKAASKWKLRRAEIDAQRSLQIAACLTLQRVYRGRLGRSERTSVAPNWQHLLLRFERKRQRRRKSNTG